MAPDHRIEVQILDDGWRTLAGAEDIALRAARAALAGTPGCEATVVLADDALLRRLNREFRGRDERTDVLSFEARDAFETATLGDVVIARETALAETGSPDSPAAADHLAHLVVHGILHLLGFDHEADDDAARMEAREIEILAGLGIADPYDGAPARVAETT